MGSAVIVTCDGTAEKVGCGAPIEWVVVEKSGKRMPIDPFPVDDGNIVKVGRETQDRTPLVAYAPPKRQGSLIEDEPRYVSHFATCPEADQFRKKVQ